ncbi:P-loop containing nucleoside triphosphate hydrolase protein [Suhomyces tanzawaensis NRRL Y-17324]|uniref:p-loop containing nucleoside triphosphate hydrolase protein n=1 Tax=Suhomyces tanzawaensis NRRL Y-17324 TaxID=984487 RepID=A0A1E4SEF4_9ASCO|nr:P-loop containing nucleoside triphosphate hydrolase protein [Suhomyces tanzawaensis NRRL Y-17324]ODV77901.1 P-loop containing nucleoside triphosphate hydrolase protein [Suhomyces tanzawaensis NRRL Y-17324]
MSFIPRRIFPNYNIPLSNFKGHHQKALTKFGHLAPQIDLVLEVRDSRAPISTTNVLFDRVLAQKQKIVLYSKKDLSVIKKDLLEKWHLSTLEDYMFIDSRNRKDARLIIELVSKKYYEMSPPPPLGLRLMIIGMPNVGKSTLVNTLREVGYASELRGSVSTKRRKVARTGGQPGVTKNTSEIIRLSKDPDILVHDTPGVFLPTVKDSETMLALSLVGCVHTSFIDPVIQADYLLYLLNLHDATGSKYSEYMDHPTNLIDELLYNIASKRGQLGPDGSYDELGTASHWVSLWKQGKLAKYRGLFDLGTILELNGSELKKLFAEERERVKSMDVSTKITDSLGEDGTARSKKRKRTAKDREYDLKNQLFKI